MKFFIIIKEKSQRIKKKNFVKIGSKQLWKHLILELRGQKVFIDTDSKKVILDFHTEVAMIKSLRHPNIVHAMGACIDPICLVTEFCTRGSLFDILQKKSLK